MLTNIHEIKIISKARQKNVRDPKRPRKHFENIFNDFFLNENFNDKIFLDLGPGQYDFGVLAKERGAKQVYAIDNDEAVIELGQYKNFNVKFGDLKKLNYDLFSSKFDGVFCKFSINALWHDNSSFYYNLERMLTNKGWAWLAPWNGKKKNSILNKADVARLLDLQVNEFKKRDFEVFILNEEHQIKYGVHGHVENNILITKNLNCNILKKLTKI